jgi:hypothetical protein
MSFVVINYNFTGVFLHPKAGELKGTEGIACQNNKVPYTAYSERYIIKFTDERTHTKIREDRHCTYHITMCCVSVFCFLNVCISQPILHE